MGNNYGKTVAPNQPDGTQGVAEVTFKDASHTDLKKLFGCVVHLPSSDNSLRNLVGCTAKELSEVKYFVFIPWFEDIRPEGTPVTIEVSLHRYTNIESPKTFTVTYEQTIVSQRENSLFYFLPCDSTENRFPEKKKVKSFKSSSFLRKKSSRLLICKDLNQILDKAGKSERNKIQLTGFQKNLSSEHSSDSKPAQFQEFYVERRTAGDSSVHVTVSEFDKLEECGVLLIQEDEEPSKVVGFYKKEVSLMQMKICTLLPNSEIAIAVEQASSATTNSTTTTTTTTTTSTAASISETDGLSSGTLAGGLISIKSYDQSENTVTMDNNKITQGLPTTTAVTTTTSSRSLFLIQSHGSSKNKIEMKNSKVNVNMQIQTLTPSVVSENKSFFSEANKGNCFRSGKRKACNSKNTPTTRTTPTTPTTTTTTSATTASISGTTPTTTTTTTATTASISGTTPTTTTTTTATTASISGTTPTTTTTTTATTASISGTTPKTTTTTTATTASISGTIPTTTTTTSATTASISGTTPTTTTTTSAATASISGTSPTTTTTTSAATASISGTTPTTTTTTSATTASISGTTPTTTTTTTAATASISGTTPTTTTTTTAATASISGTSPTTTTTTTAATASISGTSPTTTTTTTAATASISGTSPTTTTTTTAATASISGTSPTTTTTTSAATASISGTTPTTTTTTSATTASISGTTPTTTTTTPATVSTILSGTTSTTATVNTTGLSSSTFVGELPISIKSYDQSENILTIDNCEITSSRSLVSIESHGSSKNKIEMKNSKVNVNMQNQTFTAISQSHGTPSTSTKTSVASSVVDLGKASNNPKMIASSAKGSTFEEISYDPLKLHPITDDFLSVYNTTSKVQSKKMVHQDPPVSEPYRTAASTSTSLEPREGRSTDEEEDGHRYNYTYYLMLLLDIANDKLRDFFKKKWPIVHQRLKGTLQRREWSDTADDAKLLREVCKLKFFRHDSETLFSSGNTKEWDFSILKTILQNPALGFIDPQSDEITALKTLSDCRNRYAHSPDSRAISKTEFGDMWMQIRPALEVFGATHEDFVDTEELWKAMQIRSFSERNRDFSRD